MKEIKTYKIIIALLIVSCVHDILLGHIFKSFGIDPPQRGKNYGLTETVIAALIFAPLFETYICQYLPYKGLLHIRRLYKSKYFVVAYVFLATLLFSLSHYYSWMYIAATIFPGFLMSYFFHFFYKK